MKELKADAKTTEFAVREALQVIINNRESKALNYCIEYAIAGLHMQGYVLRAQIPYVLNNMQHWRGDDATAVRKILKDYMS